MVIINGYCYIMAKVLLVLGNGFDLCCGLKSSFKNYLESDFYKVKIDKMEELEQKVYKELNNSSTSYNKYQCETIDDILSRSNLNFWDWYFGLPVIQKLDEIDSWWNFEEKINKFINPIGGNGYLEITRKPSNELYKNDNR